MSNCKVCGGNIGGEEACPACGVEPQSPMSRIRELERENAELRKALRGIMEGCKIKNAMVMQIPFYKPEALIKADCLLSDYDPDDHD